VDCEAIEIMGLFGLGLGRHCSGGEGEGNFRAESGGSEASSSMAIP